MAAAVNYQLTDAHVEKFDAFVRKWQVLLNLCDWRIERVERKTSALAVVISCETEHRLAKYAVGRRWPTEPTDRQLERTARHEVLHVFFHQLTEAACEERTYNDRVLAEEHSCVIVLESLLDVLND